MIDFLMISTRSVKRDVIEIYPKFVIKKSSDLMIRGGDFYAIWIEEQGLWSTDEQDVFRIVDHELDIYAEENAKKYGELTKTVVKHMWDSSSGMVDAWHKYCQKQMRDNFHMLDEKLIFSNVVTTKKDYASKKLSYPLEQGDLSAYDRLMSVLYAPAERHKIEWAIGSIVAGDSKKLQKFMVLYGAAGTGKSTVLNIIQELFDGYYSVFDAKALGSSSNAFALEAFKSNPLVAIQHDGDLSRIEDNTRLNSLVSHELMTVNEKFKSTYANNFKCFLFMGTNKPVKITDAKSGLLRRLIDVTPSGNKIEAKEYRALTKQIGFELGAIAYYCQDIYLDDPNYYDDYIPVSMISASNDFYNYILDMYYQFHRDDSTTLKEAWEAYKTYCDSAKVSYPLSQRAFKEELKNYFWNYEERVNDDNGRMRNYYSGFREDKISGDFLTKQKKTRELKKKETRSSWIRLEQQKSLLDGICADCPAQYASEEGKPIAKWATVKTKLSDIDTSKLHYVKVPETHIVMDFDIPDETGNKSLEKNLAEASNFPPTYAELSKSGCGIHLHYIYAGDVSELNRVYSDHVEIKVFTGGSSLRRMLTKCNDIPIATISSGLPTKGDKTKVVNFDSVKSEKGLRKLVERNLNKEIHPGTKPSIDFIQKILDDAYNSGLKYDISDMQGAVLNFAAHSTNQSEYCVRAVSKMKFKSEEPSKDKVTEETPIVFYDVEIFPNLFLVCWKIAGEGKPVVRMFNPKPDQIEDLLKYRLVGFNCRRYDNHMLYACLMGYDCKQLYAMSQKIVNAKKGEKNDAFFREAYNLSYTDVHDFAATKQNLKKWEIELGIHHQELGLPWDQPVPQEIWEKVAGYCDNDVLATEAVFNHLKGDFTARKILADLAGSTVNDTTNSLANKIIFGNERKPQLIYTDLATGEQYYSEGVPVYDSEDEIPFSGIITSFPGYEFKFLDDGKKHNVYRGEDIGKGGYIRSWPMMASIVALLDIQSLHPSSMINMNYLGKYTKKYSDIKQARVLIKHGDLEGAKALLGEKAAKYLDDPKLAKDLAQALKIFLNSFYGETAASYPNPKKHPMNDNNIVALRGALFMKTLEDEVRAKGFEIAAIKTDSIKIVNPTKDIINFCLKFAENYGYSFEFEACYERFCQINDADYVARYADVDWCEKQFGIRPSDNEKHRQGEWTVTGQKFAVPYVFKTLFTHEDICFDDFCEVKEVKNGAAIYLDMNEKLPDVSGFEKELDNLEDKFKHGKISDLIFEQEAARLNEEIAKGHYYQFIGKVGQFTPIKTGCGGGILVSQKPEKNTYDAVNGTKGYRWLESETVRQTGMEDSIDKSYYDRLVNDAVDAISSYGDFEWFVSDDPVTKPDILTEQAKKVEEVMPLPWCMPCGDEQYVTCFDCPHFNDDVYHMDCGLGYDISEIIRKESERKGE